MGDPLGGPEAETATTVSSVGVPILETAVAEAEVRAVPYPSIARTITTASRVAVAGHRQRRSTVTSMYSAGVP